MQALPPAPSGTTVVDERSSSGDEHGPGDDSPSVYLGSPRRGVERYQPEPEDVALFAMAASAATEVCGDVW